MAAEVPPQLATIEAKVLDIFKELSTGFQKLDKIKDGLKQRKQLDELTGKMREAKRLIKDFDKEVKDGEPKHIPELQKLLIEKKHALIRELNTYVALRKTFTTSIGSRTDLLEGGSQGAAAGPDGVRMASTMSNQELIQTGRKQMDDTDRTIERSKKVVEDTMHIGAETAVTLKAQTEQLGRIVNELDTIQFSIKKASQLVREVGKQWVVPASLPSLIKLATDKCIMCFLMLIVVGIVTVIVVKPLLGAIKSSGERWQIVNAMHHEGDGYTLCTIVKKVKIASCYNGSEVFTAYSFYVFSCRGCLGIKFLNVTNFKRYNLLYSPVILLHFIACARQCNLPVHNKKNLWLTACSSKDQGHPSNSRNFSNVKAASTAAIVVGHGPLIFSHPSSLAHLSLQQKPAWLYFYCTIEEGCKRSMISDLSLHARLQLPLQSANIAIPADNPSC